MLTGDRTRLLWGAWGYGEATEEILSATRTPPAPSIIQFRGGRHWFQLGKHTPQRTARAILKAAFPFYNQRPSRTAPGHTPGAPPRRWERYSGIKPGLKRQHAPGVPVAARGSAHSRTIETNQHSFNYDFPCALSYVRAIMNGFMFHICAGRTYTIIVTSHSKMSLPLSTALQKR